MEKDKYTYYRFTTMLDNGVHVFPIFRVANDYVECYYPIAKYWRGWALNKLPKNVVEIPKERVALWFLSGHKKI